ncbi:MAG: bifunctional diaminohydroxyphosphoribosylaminopyrimidine deaminase/5-amino-6-(5-phosphoribosylamino)uracil reductase RibD [Candidatus Aminicenantes bacterium]|nr:bifunctional diaminohydroxyphosphoribosylaminopyrimidine deaminase/5-amino-6-(5-phosphoribosylamino)uracil reductase RibD [Candidatus Aminicenantes bacterium]
MRMAFALAEKAKGWASPNPYVGAVVVKNNRIVGYGYHERPGLPHAEIIALERAGSQGRGSTLYITLEPCVHWGRTPPCIDKVTAVLPQRVVISSPDPNPLVNGKGIKRLKESNIPVSVGLFREHNQILNETYNKYITQKIPFVILKAAASLDGKIATRNHSSQWISSSATREYVHLLRGEYDALMTGINTLIRDDPRLSVRHPNWSRKKITRIFVDSKLRFPVHAKILSTLSKGPILIFTLPSASRKKAEELQKKGAEVIVIHSSKKNIPLKDVLKILGKRGIASVLVEGGANLLTSFFENRLADKIWLSLSPKLIGGNRALSFFQGKGAAFIKDCPPLKKSRFFQIEDDIIFEGYL